MEASDPGVVERLARRLGGARIFGRLSEEGRQAFLDEVLSAATDEAPAVISCAEGETLFVPGDPATAMYVVVSGRLEEWTELPERGGHLLWPLGPGEVAGEVAMFARSSSRRANTRRTCLRCVSAGSQVCVVRRDVAKRYLRSHPAFAQVLVEGLATDALRMFEDERSFDLVCQSYYDGAAAQVAPAPFVGRDVEMYVFLCRAPEGATDAWRPPGVRAIPGFSDLFLLVFGHFAALTQPKRPDALPFCYNETALFVPCLIRPRGRLAPRLAFYSPAIYPDNQLATILGREIFGFRKREARTYIDAPAAEGAEGGDAGGERSRGRLQLFVDGKVNAAASYDRDDLPLEAYWRAAPRPIPALARLAAEHLGLDLSGAGLAELLNHLRLLLPTVPVVSVKQIPAPGHADGHVRYEVNELCLSPFLLLAVGEMSAIGGDLRVEIGGRVPFAGAGLYADVGVKVTCDLALLSSNVWRGYPKNQEPLPLARKPRTLVRRLMDLVGIGPSAFLERIDLFRAQKKAGRI